MFSADSSEYYNDFYTQYDTGMKPTTSSNAEPRLSLDSGLGLTNDSFYSSDLNESQLMDMTAATASDTSYAFQSGPLEYSPPTKWARVRTPPNRKKSAKKEERSTPDFNMFTPPNRKRIRSIFGSPSDTLKTPESLRKSIRISSPSPFKVTFSKTPLKLSNNENVTGFQIGKDGTYYNKKVNGSASKRCLLESRDGFTILGSPNSDVLDFPLQTSFDGFDLLSDTPEKANMDLEVLEGTMDYHQYAGMIESGRSSITPLPPTPQIEYVKSAPIARTASRNLLKSTQESFAIVTHHPLPEREKEVTPEPVEPVVIPKKAVPKKVLPLHSKKQSEKDKLLREANEKEMKAWKTTPFVTPRKKLQLYSGRWLVISTGRTMAQQELFSDAKNFFRTHRPTPASPAASKPSLSSWKLPTIARVTLFKHRFKSFRVAK